MFVLIRTSNVALTAFAICLTGIFSIIVCAIAAMLVCALLKVKCIALLTMVFWGAAMGGYIWRVGKHYPKEEWDFDLSALTWLQLAVLVAFFPAFYSEIEGIHYVSLESGGGGGCEMGRRPTPAGDFRHR